MNGHYVFQNTFQEIEKVEELKTEKEARKCGSVTEAQDFSKMKADCLSEGHLFEDSTFPADGSQYASQSWLNWLGLERQVLWKRPHEICSDPRFVVGDASRFDVKQGSLGDCWLVAAISNLTLHPALLQRIVPGDQSLGDGEYAGIFHFWFWQYGQWQEIIIDDKLPTVNGDLVYVRSQVYNEFWSALLEKAYAKLYGSYESLISGYTGEAMEDFTGGVTMLYELSRADKSLFKLMSKSFKNSSLMSCEILDGRSFIKSNGLLSKHAYSITGVSLIRIKTSRGSDKIPMVRIRNPHGNHKEWNGAYSDKSPEWQYVPEEEKKKIGLTIKSDGEFWMTFKDYIKHFSFMEIVYSTAEIYDKVVEEDEHTKKWQLKTFQGAFVREDTADGADLQTFWTNAQSCISVGDSDEDEDAMYTHIVCIMQKSPKSERLYIGFSIYEIDDCDHTPLDERYFKNNAPVFRLRPRQNARQICARFKLSPGTYFLVPFGEFDDLLSRLEFDEEREFIIRVFTGKSHSMQEKNSGEVGRLQNPSLPVMALKRLEAAAPYEPAFYLEAVAVSDSENDVYLFAIDDEKSSFSHLSKTHRVSPSRLTEVETETCFAVHSYEQVKHLNDVLTESMAVFRRGNFSILDVKLCDLIRVVGSKLETDSITIRDVRLNGGAASHVLASEVALPYNDTDLIFNVELSSECAYDRANFATLSTLLDFLPEGESKNRISTYSIKEACLSKMIKAIEENKWSLISLVTKSQGKNSELKFVDKMKRQFEFSVDSFQIVLDNFFGFRECSHMPISE